MKYKSLTKLLDEKIRYTGNSEIDGQIIDIKKNLTTGGVNNTWINRTYNFVEDAKNLRDHVLAEYESGRIDKDALSRANEVVNDISSVLRNEYTYTKNLKSRTKQRNILNSIEIGSYDFENRVEEINENKIEDIVEYREKKSGLGKWGKRAVLAATSLAIAACSFTGAKTTYSDKTTFVSDKPTIVRYQPSGKMPKVTKDYNLTEDGKLTVRLNGGLEDKVSSSEDLASRIEKEVVESEKNINDESIKGITASIDYNNITIKTPGVTPELELKIEAYSDIGNPFETEIIKYSNFSTVKIPFEFGPSVGNNGTIEVPRYGANIFVSTIGPTGKVADVAKFPITTDFASKVLEARRDSNSPRESLGKDGVYRVENLKNKNPLVVRTFNESGELHDFETFRLNEKGKFYAKTINAPGYPDNGILEIPRKGSVHAVQVAGESFNHLNDVSFDNTNAFSRNMIAKKANEKSPLVSDAAYAPAQKIVLEKQNIKITPPVSKETYDPLQITVEQGDSLGGIVEKLMKKPGFDSKGLNFWELVREFGGKDYNNLSDIDVIAEGQVLEAGKWLKDHEEHYVSSM
jgi:hypothetical protein